jgi:hypothetical protein
MGFDVDKSTPQMMVHKYFSCFRGFLNFVMDYNFSKEAK